MIFGLDLENQGINWEIQPLEPIIHTWYMVNDIDSISLQKNIYQENKAWFKLKRDYFDFDLPEKRSLRSSGNEGVKPSSCDIPFWIQNSVNCLQTANIQTKLWHPLPYNFIIFVTNQFHFFNFSQLFWRDFAR